MRHHLFSSASGLALDLGVALSGQAQTATIVGTVHVFGDSVRRLRDVDVVLDPTARQTRTDSSGGFRFVGVEAGECRLRVRRVGFEAIVMKVLAVADREVAVNVAMRSTAQAIATMTISGKRIDYPARLTDAYTRMRRSTGYFFTREQIDSQFPLDVNALLMRTPGIRVTGNGEFDFARCKTGRNIHVWVDGTRWTNYNGFVVDAPTAVKYIPPSSIQLMEVYSGVARIPGEYLNDACAVILIWRK